MTLEKVTKVFWRCGKGHLHPERRVAEECEARTAAAIEKQKRRQDFRGRVAARQTDRHERIKRTMRPPSNLVETGEFAGLSARVVRLLEFDNVLTKEQLAEKSEAEMLRCPDFGVVALCEIKEWMAKQTPPLSFDG